MLLAATPAAAMTVSPDRPDGPASAAPAQLVDPLASTAQSETADGEVSITMAAFDAAVDLGDDGPAAPQTVALTVEIVNGTERPVAPGVLEVRRSAPIGSPGILDAWLSGETGATDAPVVASIETRPIPPGASFTATLSVPRDQLPSGAAPTVYGLAGELARPDGTAAASGRGSLVVTGPGEAAGPAPLGLALAFPLTVPPSGTGIVPAEDLELWTAPTGLLTRQLDSVEGRPVAVAVDPQIIASIRLLGDAAPESAVAWLERLQALPNETFPLAYADADPAVQSQLGLPAPLAPISFTDVLDPARFDGVPPQPEPSDAGDEADAARPAGADDEPAPDPVPTTLPDTAELLDWPYTRSDIAWPRPGTLAAGDLSFLARAGLTTSIVGEVDVARAAAGTSNAAASVDGATALVADDRLSASLQEAATALSDPARRAAASDAAARLALLAGEAAGDRTVLAVFARQAPSSGELMPSLIDAIAALDWMRPAALGEAIGAPPVEGALVEASEGELRLSYADRMLRAEEEVASFASVVDDPELLTGPTRRDLLAVLGIGWFDEPEEWELAVGENLAAAHDVTGAVSIVPSSPILVVSSESGVPLAVQNDLDYPVNVVVTAVPENGRLVIEDGAEITVEPNSRGSVSIPVAAGVGNGEVRLEVTLHSPSGEQIGQPEWIDANVQADWEGIGAVVLAVVAVAFFGIGIVRAVLRRRRARASVPDGTDGETDAGSGMDAGSRPADDDEAPNAHEERRDG